MIFADHLQAGVQHIARHVHDSIVLLERLGHAKDVQIMFGDVQRDLTRIEADCREIADALFEAMTHNQPGK